jgi:hypothetical protein
VVELPGSVTGQERLCAPGVEYSVEESVESCGLAWNLRRGCAIHGFQRLTGTQ